MTPIKARRDVYPSKRSERDYYNTVYFLRFLFWVGLLKRDTVMDALNILENQ